MRQDIRDTIENNLEDIKRSNHEMQDLQMRAVNYAEVEFALYSALKAYAEADIREGDNENLEDLSRLLYKLAERVDDELQERDKDLSF